MIPRIDVSAWVGAYPFRELPHPDAETLATRVLAREGYTAAWVGHLPGAFHRDPSSSNDALLRMLEPFRDVLHPAPIVRPDWPGWERTLQDVVREGAPSVRAYPAQWGLGPRHPALNELAMACGQEGVVLHVTVRFEDSRQRHPMDSANDVSAALIRGIARLPHSQCHLVVAGASRELIEETHWGLTPHEQLRVWYDFSWLWGPPEDHFAHLVRTVGPECLAWGTYWPLRLTQQCRALVDLLPDDLHDIAPAHAFADGARIGMLARAQRARTSISL